MVYIPRNFATIKLLVSSFKERIFDQGKKESGPESHFKMFPGAFVNCCD